MIGAKRTTLEILQDILKLVAQDQRKTRIMYGANLSYDMLVKYLEFLRARQLVGLDEGSGKFYLTESGREFLRDLDKVTRRLAEAEQVLA